MSHDNAGPETGAPEAKEGSSGMSRRKALLTLGFAGLAAYAAPTLLGLSEAEAQRRWTRTSRHRRHRRWRRRRWTRTSRHFRYNRWRPYRRRRNGIYLHIR